MERFFFNSSNQVIYTGIQDVPGKVCPERGSFFSGVCRAVAFRLIMHLYYFKKYPPVLPVACNISNLCLIIICAMKRKLITEWIPALLILLFAYTAFSKLLDYRRFAIVLSQLPFLKAEAAVTGWLLPVAELGAVALPSIPATRLQVFSCRLACY
jgi:hypothetical protein